MLLYNNVYPPPFNYNEDGLVQLWTSTIADDDDDNNVCLVTTRSTYKGESKINHF